MWKRPGPENPRRGVCVFGPYDCSRRAFMFSGGGSAVGNAHMRVCCFLASVFLAVTGATSVASAGPNLPRDIKLPDDMEVVSPQDVSEELKFFSGMWIGKWDNRLNHVLVVERISPVEHLGRSIHGATTHSGDLLGVWKDRRAAPSAQRSWSSRFPAGLPRAIHDRGM